jgi:Leucine-rich repeat (LRR) protein
MIRTWNNEDDMINDMKNMDFFNEIIELKIRGNIKFNTLPNKLTYLDCFNNQLTSLPTLPNTLEHLDCRLNQLSSLPTLPNSLKKLACSNNQLLKLPFLPKMLKYVDCENNKLLGLPNVPKKIVWLYCYNNPFNLWKDLISTNEIDEDVDMREFICEKLSILDDRIQELQSNLNKGKYIDYNKKMRKIKKDIKKILNAKYEIIL